MTVFAERIKARRKELKMSQKDVAEKLHMDATSFWRYEQGMVDPRISFVEELAEVLQTRPEYLAGWDFMPLPEK